MKTKLLLILCLISGIFSYSQQGVELKKNLYKDILNFAIKAPNLNSIGDGLEKVGFKISDTSTSNDGKFITTTYNLPDNERLLIIRAISNSSVYKIYFVQKLDISYFIIDYLGSIANTYEPNHIWYNNERTVLYSYKIDSNTGGLLELTSL